MKQNVLNKLNGLQPGEESFIDLEQSISESKVITADLADLLKDSEVYKSLKVGEDALIQSFTVEPTGRLAFTVSFGKVTKVENKAFLGNLKKALG